MSLEPGVEAVYHVTHRTTYEYSARVAVSRHLAYVDPLNKPGEQVVEASSLKIEPKPAEESVREDFFGNRQRHFQIEVPHRELVVEAKSRVRVTRRLPDEGLPGPTVGELRAQLEADTRREWLDARYFVMPSWYVPSLAAADRFGAAILDPARPVLEAVKALNHAIWGGFKYSPGVTDVNTPVEEVLRLRRGVCQDFAHLMLSVLRGHGLAAKYVSGYLLTHPPEGQKRLEGADASHAWVAVFVPGEGWVGLDPTNDVFCGNEHIEVATGRDYLDVSPLKGAVTGGGEQTIRIEVTVAPVGEAVFEPA